ncbi:MAG: ACP phosphodiesterase [Ferruginibacter sp.]|nr:ACP phosphodiesterase [Ferruginibacter sp.]
MNYLAHAFLSFNNTDLLVGNMISDYVKGKKQFEYSASIQAGIKLHRAIDEFTDTHEATFEIKKYFKPAYRLYAGAFTDVVYDYFLANDANEFTNHNSLKIFTQKTYKMLEGQTVHFPEKFAAMFPYMQAQDWLYHYQFNEGMQKSFGGLARRAKYMEETDTAYQIFLTNKDSIKAWYNIFFPQVKLFAAHKAALLLNR